MKMHLVGSLITWRSIMLQFVFDSNYS